MRIGIQNFQGVGAYTEIELAPLTLLYGPNSAGKSTVLDALEFIQTYFGGNEQEALESLKRLARYPRKRDNPRADLASIRDVNLSSGHIGSQDDIALLISSKFSAEDSVPSAPMLSVDYDSSNGQFTALYEAIDGVNYSVLVSFSEPELEFDVHHRQRSGWFKLNTYYLEIDGIPFFIDAMRNLRYPDYEEVGGFAFNFSHPVMERMGERIKNLVEAVFDKPKAKAKHLLRGQLSSVEYHLFPNDRDDKGTSRRKNRRKASWQMFNGRLRVNDLELDWAKWATLRAAIRDASLDAEDAEFLAQFLNLIFKFHCPNANRQKYLTSVPPLRNIPSPREWIPVKTADLSPRLKKIKRKTSLNSPWNELAFYFAKWAISDKRSEGINTAPTFRMLNEALAGKDYLALGYEIRGSIVFELESTYVDWVTSGGETHWDRLGYCDSKVHFFLWDLRLDTQVELQDVGVGVSQVIPVLAAATGIESSPQHEDSQTSVVFIQQPELHLHPALQAQLGDVFLRSLEKSTHSHLVLETHSEHLLLRILRRIAETHMVAQSDRGDVFEKMPESAIHRPQARASKIAVIYASKDDQGLTKFKRLRLSEDGEFIDRWPGGFFAERDRELFPEE